MTVSVTQTCLGHSMSKDDTYFVDMKSSPPMNELNARACMVCKMHDIPTENGAFRPQQTLATPPWLWYLQNFQKLFKFYQWGCSVFAEKRSVSFDDHYSSQTAMKCILMKGHPFQKYLATPFAGVDTVIRTHASPRRAIPWRHARVNRRVRWLVVASTRRTLP